MLERLVSYAKYVCTERALSTIPDFDHQAWTKEKSTPRLLLDWHASVSRNYTSTTILEPELQIFRELNNNTILKGADCVDMWGFIQTPMLGRKSWKNDQGYVAREKPAKYQSCKSFSPTKK